MSISLVILTYNEIAGLKCIVDNIPFGDVDEYYAIDGGSTDGTVEFLQKNGIKVYGQKIKGRGENTLNILIDFVKNYKKPDFEFGIEILSRFRIRNQAFFVKI